jgi:TonB family protein
LRPLQGWTAIVLLGLAALSAGYPVPAVAQAELNRKVKIKIAPTYPELARRINLRGTVKLMVVVLPNGNVKDTKVMGGNPILVNAAIDALKKWKFESSPEESSGTIEFKFEPSE